MIFFFSATGNSKYCAEKIASTTGDRLVSMNDLMKRGITEIDCGNDPALGIVAPTYDMDLAYVVKEYLQEVEFVNLDNDTYVYGLITCGKTSGYAKDSLETILGRKGIHLNTAFTISLPDNYVLMFPVEDPEKQARHLSWAEETLVKAIGNIAARRNVFAKVQKPPKMMMAAIRKFVIPSQRKVRNFSVNESCIGCGQCERICPKNIIQMKDGRPIWVRDDCACCLGCLHRCPKQAIERGKSRQNGRYVNPNVIL